MIIAALVIALAGAVCPSYNCTSLTTGTCASYYSSSEYHINLNPCPSGSYCSYADLVQWVELGLVTTTEPTLYCIATNDGEIEAPTVESAYQCGTREDYRDLQSGSYPKKCSNYLDCQLEDGTYNTCSCGMDGNAYCDPDISSSYYDKYWEECWSDGNYGRISNFDHWAYWELKITYYVSYISAYSCAHYLFSEFIQIDDLDYIGDLASYVVLGGAWLLSLA